MNSLLSAVAFRTLLCDTTDEFQALNSAKLPDGATVFNREENTLWRLNKFIGDDFDALSAAVIQRPDDLTDARWFAEVSSFGNLYEFSGYVAAAVAVTMTSNQWNPLGSTAGTFAAATGSSTGLFTQSPTTGVITYNGPARLAVITMTAAINNGIGATPIAMHAAVSVDGDVVTGTTTLYPEKGEMGQSVINTLQMITVRRTVLLSAGSTYRMTFRNATNGDDIVVNFYQVEIEPL